jgi:hypothetical protein
MAIHRNFIGGCRIAAADTLPAIAPSDSRGTGFGAPRTVAPRHRVP